VFPHNVTAPGNDCLAVGTVEEVDLDLHELAQRISMLELQEGARYAQVEHPAIVPLGSVLGPDSGWPGNFLSARAIGVLPRHRRRESKIRGRFELAAHVANWLNLQLFGQLNERGLLAANSVNLSCRENSTQRFSVV